MSKCSAVKLGAAAVPSRLGRKMAEICAYDFEKQGFVPYFDIPLSEDAARKIGVILHAELPRLTLGLLVSTCTSESEGAFSLEGGKITDVLESGDTDWKKAGL